MKSSAITAKINAGTATGGVLVAVTILTAIVHYKQVLGYLPREVAGVWLLFWSFGSYLAFFDLGMSPTLSREIAFLSAAPGHTSNPHASNDLIATCLRIYLTVAAIVLGAALLAGALFLPTLTLASLPIRDALVAWALFATGACVNLVGNISYAMLTGSGQVATERLTRAATMVIWLGLSASALVFGYGLIGLAAAWLAHACISRMMAAGAARALVPHLRLRGGAWQAATARRLARPSGQWALTQFGALMILQTDNLLIAWNLGPAAIPSYEAAAKVVMAMGTIALLRTNASTPYYSRAAVTGDKGALRDVLYRNVRQGLLVMAAATAFLGFFGPDLFKLWLGPGNFVGYPVLLALLAMMTLETHHVSHATLTMATGSIPFVRPALTAGVLNLVFSYALLQWLGLLGVALGTLLAQIATNNWFAPYVTLKIVSVRPWDYLRAIVPRYAATLLCFVAVQGVTAWSCKGQESWLRVLAGGGAAVILYWLAARSADATPSGLPHP